MSESESAELAIERRRPAFRFSLRVAIIALAFAACVFQFYRQHKEIRDLRAKASTLEAEAREFVPVPFDTVAAAFEQQVLSQLTNWIVFSISYHVASDSYAIHYAPKPKPGYGPSFKLVARLTREGSWYKGEAATKKLWNATAAERDAQPKIPVHVAADPKFAPNPPEFPEGHSTLMKVYDPR